MWVRPFVEQPLEREASPQRLVQISQAFTLEVVRVASGDVPFWGIRVSPVGSSAAAGGVHAYLAAVADRHLAARLLALVWDALARGDRTLDLAAIASTAATASAA